MSVMRKQTN